MGNLICDSGATNTVLPVSMFTEGFMNHEPNLESHLRRHEPGGRAYIGLDSPPLLAMVLR
ncbi:hypothetical protein A2U01_0064212 [Trifolium medium]|uniref:Uncharacterized protein n=1 Tax=Trifolium medium TaxID=97028 RepID=A0A392S507_9FABA|nr:hypothetical protein [Trifolium medium]